MKRMKSYLMIFLVCSVGVVLCYSTVFSNPYSTLPPEIEFSLLDEGPYMVGEPIRYQCLLRNTSDKELRLIKPVNGSSTEIRFPRYLLKVVNPHKLQLSPYPVLFGCGNTNPIMDKDFITLKPGESLNINNGWIKTTFTPFLAGQYQLSYVVQFHENDAYFQCLSEFKKLLKYIPRFKAESKPITINVQSNGKTNDPSIHCLMGMPKEEVLRLYLQHWNFDEWGKLNLSNTEYSNKLPSNYLHPIANIPSIGYKLLLHFNSNDNVDGVVVFKESYNQQHLDESMLIWMRGHEQDAMPDERIIRDENGITEIYVGVLSNM